MKNRKLLFLLVAILSLTVIFAACDQTEAEGSSDVQSTTAETQSGTEQTQESETEQNILDHEFYDYFKPLEDEEYGLSGDVLQLEGEFPNYNGDIDREHDLIVLKTQDLDVYNNVHDTYTVYDLISGEKLLEKSISYPLYEEGGKADELQVIINYPVICVNKTSYSEDSKGEYTPEYEYTYYLISNTETPLHTTTSDDYDRVECGNGLVMLTLGDKVFWIDRNLEIVRTIEAVIANGYDFSEDMFNAEYQGYVYVWDEYNSREIQVFNRSGMCSATYVMEKDGYLNLHVLNNGNVLIQEMELRESPFGAYDFKLNGQYCTVNNYIMSFIDGSLTEIELDFVVETLGTAYAQICDYSDSYMLGFEFGFELAAGRENQAFIYRYAGGKMSYTPEYVCINSNLEIEYSVKNDTEGVFLSYATLISDRYYAALVSAAGVMQYHIFDLDGNDVAIFAGRFANDFVVTDTTIYDINMDPIYSFADNGYTLSKVDNATGVIFLYKLNFRTGGYEYYIFDTELKQPVMIADGVDDSYFDSITNSQGVYMTYDHETRALTVLSLVDGEVLAIARSDNMECYYTETAMIIEPNFEDENIIYVIK